MKHTTLIAGILVAATSIAATAVFAAGGGHGMKAGDKFGMRGERPTFEMLDADSNNEITQEEMQAHMQARFAKADADADGKITKDEMIAAGQSRIADRAQAMLDRFDADGDGALTSEEMPKPKNPERMFKFADKDGNGSISKEEFEQLGRNRDKGGHGHKNHGGKKY